MRPWRRRSRLRCGFWQNGWRSARFGSSHQAISGRRSRQRSARTCTHKQMEVLLLFWGAVRQEKADERATGTVEAFDAPDARPKRNREAAARLAAGAFV